MAYYATLQLKLSAFELDKNRRDDMQVFFSFFTLLCYQIEQKPRGSRHVGIRFNKWVSGFGER